MVSIELIVAEYVEEFLGFLVYNQMSEDYIDPKDFLGNFYKKIYGEYMDWYRKYKDELPKIFDKNIIKTIKKLENSTSEKRKFLTDHLNKIKNQEIFKNLVKIRGNFINRSFVPGYDENFPELMRAHLFMYSIRKQSLRNDNFEPSIVYTKKDKLYGTMLLAEYFRDYIPRHISNEISEYVFI